MKVKTLILLLFLILGLSPSIKAQYMAPVNAPAEEAAPETVLRQDTLKGNWFQWFKNRDIADHLDAGITLGSTGIGLEVKTPVTKWVDVRAGVDWLPRFSVPMTFNLNTYTDGMPTGNFSHVASMVYEFTGIHVDETVKMNGKGSMVNFKFMVDVFPIPNNHHWHVTVGFFAGTSKIATAINTLDEKPTLVGLNIYNRGYQYFTGLQSNHNVPFGVGYLPPDLVQKLRDRFDTYGRIGIHIGDYKEGTPYIMEPAPDGTISADAFVNHFKPYLGVGYNTDIDKKGRWHFGVDAGAMFWGGAPDVINHDYANGRDVSFTHDLKNIRGKVGSYMKIVKALPVYPVITVRFSYTIL